jgi:hypothetical protein
MQGLRAQSMRADRAIPDFFPAMMRVGTGLAMFPWIGCLEPAFRDAAVRSPAMPQCILPTATLTMSLLNGDVSLYWGRARAREINLS